MMIIPPYKLVVFGAFLFGVVSTTTKAGEIEAVSSKASEDYVRIKASDGSFRPESYAFGQGGFHSGNLKDKSVDEIKFAEIIETIAVPLARQNYIASKDPRTTKLLIMVYWGATAPQPEKDSPEFQYTSTANQMLQQAKASGDPDAIRSADNAYSAAIAALHTQNAASRRIDARNASLLGYDSWWDATSSREGTVFDGRWHDMLEELQGSRYFVVLMAYDFQLMWKEKKPKLLWETRFSISERGNEFDKQLLGMTLYASKYFGRNSDGLVHRNLPEGHITLGELKVLGVETDK